MLRCQIHNIPKYDENHTLTVIPPTRHIPAMSALPPLLLRLEEQCAKHAANMATLERQLKDEIATVSKEANAKHD